MSAEDNTPPYYSICETQKAEHTVQAVTDATTTVLTACLLCGGPMVKTDDAPAALRNLSGDAGDPPNVEFTTGGGRAEPVE